MSRSGYPKVMRNGRLVSKHKAAPRSATYIASDDLGSDLEHHGYSDGRSTSSKSEFRRWTKEAGLTEKGNDREAPRRMDSAADMRRDVAQATQMVLQGYKPTIGREW